MSADTSILPSELLVTPLPLIGFTGLDVAKNPVHKRIWETFSANKKNDRAHVQYKLLPPTYEFPVSKPKRQSYEWYQPKGILKKNWLLKHQHVLPAVVVLFQDMDWNDMQWSEHQLRCAAAVQSLKNALQGQSTKIAIALLQRASHLPPSEEQLAQERTAALASTCDLNPKLIFVFPYNEHLGYMYRLEASFVELAQSYYTQMAKQIRMHRDQLTDSAHLALKIRHQFKLGVIAEIRQDHAAALKNYSQAYAQLDDIRVVDTNCLEVKTIAGFLNYKICRLMFRSVPRDAIAHFKAHIERFRGRTGFREIMFEHYAWLSFQYSAFAELFCDAIKLGLPALQTQNPGIYYYKAAEYMGQRKQCFYECLAATAASAASTAPTTAAAGAPNAAADANASYANQFYSEFFGVRTTKIGDAATEQQQFALVQANEMNFNHSIAIIAILGQAMAQFKMYRCLRFRKKLAVEMAEEYLQCGDHSKALTLYSLMLTDYRDDQWYGVFTQILLKTLQAARLSASIADFLTCSIETMSPLITIDRRQRLAIMDNFWRVLQNSPPVADAADAAIDAKRPAHLAPVLAAAVQPAWTLALQKLQHHATGTPIVVVDLDRLTELFECTLTFREAQVLHDEPLHVDLYIRTRSEISFKLSSVRAVLADSGLQFTLPAKRWTSVPARRRLNTVGDADDETIRWQPLAVGPSAAAGNDILLQPNVCYKFSFCEADYKFPENEELRIVRLELAVSMGRHAVLLLQSTTLNRAPVFRPLDPAGQSMDQVCVHRVCYVVPTFHLTTTHRTGGGDSGQQPMLTNEYFRTEQVLCNTFDVALQQVGLSVSVPPALKSSVFLCTDLGKQTQRLQSALHFDIGDVAALASTTVAYYVIALCEGNVDLRQRLWYQVPERRPQQQQQPIETAALVVESPVHKAAAAVASAASALAAGGAATAAAATLRSQTQHNMSIERLPDGAGVRKCRDDVIIVPCVEEVSLRARFFTLNKQPLRRAYCDEDVLLRVDVEVRAPCELDVLEMFFISDHNITENAQHQKQQRKQFASGCSRGHQLRDVKMLRARATSAHWQRKPDAAAADGTKSKPHIDWQRRGSAARLTATGAEFHTISDHQRDQPAPAGSPDSVGVTAADKYKSNLLAKIPANSTIIGSTGAMSSNLMNRSLTSGSTVELAGTPDAKQHRLPGAIESPLATVADSASASIAASTRPAVKHVFNRAIDSFVLTDHCRGFLRDKALSDVPAGDGAVATTPAWPIWGVYCVRWRRSGDPNAPENESKFVVHGIEVVDPPLNIYCYLDDRMYVKVPMTLTVAIRNPTRYAMHLRTCLKNSEHFMFSGNTQLNVSIFARSTFELSFNLYPLKAGWQSLPEFEVKYNTQYDEKIASTSATPAATGALASLPAVVGSGDAATGGSAAVEVNQELQHLTQRWMPKKVFVLPMLKHSQG